MNVNVEGLQIIKGRVHIVTIAHNESAHNQISKLKTSDNISVNGFTMSLTGTPCKTTPDGDIWMLPVYLNDVAGYIQNTSYEMH